MTKWDQILREKWYSQEEPDESVVNFASLIKKKNKEGRVLDLGCGAGRHLIYMASQGLEAHGVDTSETGLKLTMERLIRRNLKARPIKCDMKMLPYVDSCFDAVISLHIIYHQKLWEIQKNNFRNSKDIEERRININQLSIKKNLQLWKRSGS